MATTILPPRNTRSAVETASVGEELAAQLRPGSVVALYGELGAGKTCLVKGIARGLGIREQITSPTFTLVHEHRSGRLPLYHIDLYRLDSVTAALSIGIEDYLPPGDGVAVIEWAEKIADLVPGQSLRVRIRTTGESERSIEFA